MGLNPTTPAEWQEAVTMAEAALLLDLAREIGLVTGGPNVNVARCEEILLLGRSRGILPDQEAAERMFSAGG